MHTHPCCLVSLSLNLPCVPTRCYSPTWRRSCVCTETFWPWWRSCCTQTPTRITKWDAASFTLWVFEITHMLTFLSVLPISVLSTHPYRIKSKTGIVNWTSTTRIWTSQQFSLLSDLLFLLNQPNRSMEVSWTKYITCSYSARHCSTERLF